MNAFAYVKCQVFFYLKKNQQTARNVVVNCSIINKFDIPIFTISMYIYEYT